MMENWLRENGYIVKEEDYNTMSKSSYSGYPRYYGKRYAPPSDSGWWEPGMGYNTSIKTKHFRKPKPRYISTIKLKNGYSIFMAPYYGMMTNELKSFDKYIEHFTRNGVKTVVYMLERPEKGVKYLRKGLSIIHVPIRDYGVPKNIVEFSSRIHDVRRALKRGSTLFHCQGGNGRTGLVVACVLVQMGMEPDKAIRYVRKYRPEAIENKKQEDFIHDFHEFSQEWR